MARYLPEGALLNKNVYVWYFHTHKNNAPYFLENAHFLDNIALSLFGLCVTSKK